MKGRLLTANPQLVTTKQRPQQQQRVALVLPHQPSAAVCATAPLAPSALQLNNRHRLHNSGYQDMSAREVSVARPAYDSARRTPNR